MNQKSQRSQRVSNSKQVPDPPKGKAKQSKETSTEPKKEDTKINDSTQLKTRSQRNPKKEDTPNNQPQQKLVAWDEFAEAQKFIQTIKKIPEKAEPPKPRDSFAEAMRLFRNEIRENKKKIFQAFDKIQLGPELPKQKVRKSSDHMEIVEPEVENKKEEEEDKMELEEPVVQEEPENNDNPAMEIEETQEEEPAKPKSDIFERLRAKVVLDVEEDIDDLLINLNFEPRLEMIRASTHIDIDSVADIIEAPEDKNTDNVAAVIANLDENQKKINEIVSTVSNQDLLRLDPDIYLNDNLINFYLKLIELALINDERRKKVQIMNTYFLPKMKTLFTKYQEDFNEFDKVYEGMQRWIKKVDLFEKDYVLMPLNDNEHWNTVVFCNPSSFFTNDDSLPSVVFLDSLGRMDETNAKMMYYFFEKIAKSKKKSEDIVQKKFERITALNFPYYQPMLPKQSNLTDCGLYLLQYCELFADNESYVIGDQTTIEKTEWFPRKLISDKREDMRRLIKKLKEGSFDVIEEYLKKRRKIIREYRDDADEYSYFDEKAFESSIEGKLKQTPTPEQMNIFKLDFYYMASE